MTFHHTFGRWCKTIILIISTSGCLLAAGTVQALEYEAGHSNASAAQAGERAMQVKQRIERLRTTIAVHKKHTRDLMAHDDVVASGVGLGPDGEPVIKLFTKKAVKRGIPEMLDGVRVHTEVSGRFYARRGITCDISDEGVCDTNERWPLPVPIGVSVGHPLITAGTIGARVTDGANVFILSNNHVLAAVNQANLGDAALQPGAFDGGTADDAIGSLTDYEPIDMCTVLFIWLICNQTNTIDAAIALSTPAELGSSTPTGEFGSAIGYGVPNQIIHSAYGAPDILGDEDLVQLLGIELQKFGRTTALTTGTVDTIGVTINVCYDDACTLVAQFVDQILVGPGTFSGPGDSGSLVVTNDNNKYPVGLVFAGSDTVTVINRIDLVLNRFNVVIDDGGVSEPVVDLAITDIEVPSSVVVGESQAVTVTLKNVGTELIDSATVTLVDTTQPGTVTIETPNDPVITNLEAGATTSVEFSWAPTLEATHTLQATHQLADDNTTNDTVSRDVDVVATLPSGPQLRLQQVQAFTNQWTTVQLDQDYGSEMVVVCTPNYDFSATGPAVVRVKNANGTSFEVGLGRPWYGGYDTDHFSSNVYCMVMREGVYSVAEHGVKLEAVKLPGFTSTDNSSSWLGEPRTYQHPAGYTNPVVVGQVVSPDDGLIPSYCPAPNFFCEPNWSVFWSRGPSASSPPTSNALYVGRHTGQDPNGRAAETVMYVVIEAGSGNIEGRGYVAALGADTIRGMQNNPPFTYNLSGLSSATMAIASQAAMDGRDGGWAVLYGPNAISASQLRLAIEEDWYLDSERRHTTEQVGYIVFE